MTDVNKDLTSADRVLILVGSIRQYQMAGNVSDEMSARAEARYFAHKISHCPPNERAGVQKAIQVLSEINPDRAEEVKRCLRMAAQGVKYP